VHLRACAGEKSGTIDGEMSQASSVRTCQSCNAEAPVTETGYTLISTKHAWRCKKVALGEGQPPQLVWYCPNCWKKAARPQTKA
jgi:hypothetical protein